MKKNIGISIDEDVHREMKAIALQKKMKVYELYEEIAREFINKNRNQTTLDD